MNPGRVGYYRVSYSTDLFSSVLVALKDGALSPMDRLGLQNDAFALVCIAIISKQQQQTSEFLGSLFFLTGHAFDFLLKILFTCLDYIVFF